MGAKKSMKLPELQKLAQRVQLNIKPEEVSLLLNSLSELEKLLAKFRQLKLEDNQPYHSQAKTTLPSLRQLAKKFSGHNCQPTTIGHNATVSGQNFLVVNKLTD